MLVIEEGSTIAVYAQGGRLVHKSFGVVQYEKLTESSLVVITKDCINFIREIKVGRRKDVLVVTDTDFEEALIKDEIVYVSRNIKIPVLDLYDKNLDNFFRLHRDFKGRWVYADTVFGFPLKLYTPLTFHYPYVFVKRDKKCYRVDLRKGKTFLSSPSKVTGINIGKVISLFK